MAVRRSRIKPTPYPRVLFHLLRAFQLTSSIVVASILLYFLHELLSSHYRLPWTFILLLSVALLTIFSLAATIVLHCCYGLNPALNTVLNSILALVWAVSFALLSWWSVGTLRHVCNKESWEDETGIMVCRLYKALFSFALVGFVSTFLALMLDIHVQRGAIRRGKFTALQDLDGKFTAEHEGHAYSNGFSDQSDVNPNPSAAWYQRQRPRGGEGYALPEEQFAYGEEADTVYHGAGGQVERKSLEKRT